MPYHHTKFLASNNKHNNNNNNNLFVIPKIHQSGYRASQQITINMVQNECQQKIHRSMDCDYNT